MCTPYVQKGEVCVMRQVGIRKRALGAGCPEGSLAAFCGIAHPTFSRWLGGKIKFDHARRQRIDLVLRSIEALAASSPVPIDFRNTKRIAPFLRAIQERIESEVEKPSPRDAVESAAAS